MDALPFKFDIMVERSGGSGPGRAFKKNSNVSQRCFLIRLSSSRLMFKVGTFCNLFKRSRVARTDKYLSSDWVPVSLRSASTLWYRPDFGTRISVTSIRWDDALSSPRMFSQLERIRSGEQWN